MAVNFPRERKENWWPEVLASFGDTINQTPKIGKPLLRMGFIGQGTLVNSVVKGVL